MTPINNVCARSLRKLFRKGNIPWNKGLTKETDPRIKSLSEEHRRKISEAISGENHPMYGKHLTAETKLKIAKTKMGSKNPMWKGDEATEKTIQWRLQRDMPVPKGHERHHIDGNIRNSDPSNILVLTRREHMIEDGRMEDLIKRNKVRAATAKRRKKKGRFTREEQ